MDLFGRKWSAKEYIVAALLGALVAIVVVAGISISLAPAHISFSIASATISNGNGNAAHSAAAGGGGGDRYYNFTLVANNTSGRTWVRYGSLSAEIWNSPSRWVPVDVNATAKLPGWQRPGNATQVAVQAKYGQYSEAGNATQPAAPPPSGQHSEAGDTTHPAAAAAPAPSSNADLPDSRVVVEAKVSFRFGLVTTATYTVRASCWPVNFLNNNASNFPVDCSS